MSDAASFSISNRRLIIHNLSLLIKNDCLVSIYFGEDKTFLLTAILEVDEANNLIIFDYGLNNVVNNQLLEATKIIFQADISGIKVSFKGIGVKQILYKQGPAFTMPIPDSMFWLQRREFFRVTSPQSISSYCQMTLRSRKPVNLMLYDISLTGFSALSTSAEQSTLLVPGAQFEQCKLVLSGAGEDIIAIKIRSKLITNPSKINELKVHKIGCLITRITPSFQTTVQRYVNQLQRENIQNMRRHE